MTHGIYINKGDEGFRSSRNSEYVDKSGLIAIVNSTLDTEQRFSCVTRSRRFGKTMAAKMLQAYYDKSCDSRSLFADSEIALGMSPSFMAMVTLLTKHGYLSPKMVVKNTAP